MSQALAAVNADPKLNMARFCLVPTYIKEEEFWRNWFYRVQIILAAYGLEIPKKSADKVLPAPTTASVLSVEDSLSRKIEKELGELGINTSESNPESWEEELKRELSSLDPSKEAPDSLLSQNWEEELMLELGLNSTGLSKESPRIDNVLADPAPQIDIPLSDNNASISKLVQSSTTLVDSVMSTDIQPSTSLTPSDFTESIAAPIPSDIQ